MTDTWFFRFAIRKDGNVIEISTLASASDPYKAWNALVDEQVARHEIGRTDIDILAMNKVS